MQESIQAALSVVRSRAQRLGIADDVFQNRDIHIHLPEGATPKDGPSAGTGICTAMVSALTGITVRADVAMTGEITLRGEVLVIGGLKEKLLAAHRGQIKTVLIPEDNAKDLADIPENEERHGDRAGGAHGRGVEAGAGPRSGGDRMERDQPAHHARGRRRGRSGRPRGALSP
jgi:ATP-dependent Lon protease